MRAKEAERERAPKEQKQQEQQLRKDMHALHQAEMRIALLDRQLKDKIEKENQKLIPTTTSNVTLQSIINSNAVTSLHSHITVIHCRRL